MWRQLRPGSPRPELVVSDHAIGVADPTTGDRLGMPGPFGRNRIISALPLKDGPVLLQPARVLHDSNGCYIADPDGNLVGMPAQRVSRMISARWTEDTRRL